MPTKRKLASLNINQRRNITKLNNRFTVTALVLVLALALAAIWVLPTFAQEECPCEGGVTHMTLEYLGTATASVEVRHLQGSTEDATLFGPSDVAPGGLVSFNGEGLPKHPPNMTPNVNVYVGSDPVPTTFHTSCSQPMYVGLTIGLFKVVYYKSLTYGQECPESCVSGEVTADGGDYSGATTIEWDITNNSTHALVMEGLFDVQWPTGNGNLVGAAFEGTPIWAGSEGEIAQIDLSGTGNRDARALAVGETKTLVLTFLTASNPPTTGDPYSVVVQFYGDDCKGEGVAEPTVITLSSFAAKPSAGGSASASRLWLGLAGLAVAAGSFFWAKRRTG